MDVISERETFLRKVEADWPSAKMAEYLRSWEPPAPSSLSLVNRIAFAGSGRFFAELSRYADLTRIEGPEAAPAVEPQSFDCLLVEGRWLGVDEPWRGPMLDLPAGRRGALATLVESFRAASVPAVLWLLDEPGSRENLQHLFDLFDVVFAPSAWRLEHPRARVLEPGVDVKRFNPYRDDGKAKRSDAAVFKFLVDGAFEWMSKYPAAEMQALLEPLLDEKAWLVDSSFALRNNNQKLTPQLRRRFVGCFQEAEFSLLLKSASAALFPGRWHDDRPVHFTRRLLEAAATKTLVTSERRVEPAVGVPSFCPADDASGVGRILARVKDDPVAALALTHVGWRAAISEHSQFERLSEILRAVGKAPAFNKPLAPRVNIVVPTIRPDLIPYVIETFDSQTYPDKTLTIVANGVKVPPALRQRVADREDISLLSVPADKSIGYCMNYGIDHREAEYWAKIDDDDIYGPEYLADGMLQTKYLDFDVSGKGAVFAYFEEEDRIILQRPDLTDCRFTHLGGGSLIVRNNNYYFPEDVRGYADALFLAETLDKGATIVSADAFNFVQVRRADPGSHTWTAGAHKFEATGPSRSGLDFRHVLI